MKPRIFIFFSKANQDIFTVVATDKESAAQECVNYCKATAKIISDDYILVTSSGTEIGHISSAVVGDL